MFRRQKKANVSIDNLGLSSDNADCINSVYQTYKYDLFSHFKGNRPKNVYHIARLIKSLKQNHIPVPIIVNEFYKIADGQNRFEACKELKLPINYIVIPGLTLEDVQLLNANMRPWTNDDYLESYCELNENINYRLFRRFKQEHDFSITNCLCILLDRSTGIKDTESFKEGTLVIPDIEQADINAKKINMVKRYSEHYKLKPFIGAMLSLFKNNLYNHEQFIKKLSMHPGRLESRKNVRDFKRHIEDIYNFKTYDRNRVRFD